MHLVDTSVVCPLGYQRHGQEAQRVERRVGTQSRRRTETLTSTPDGRYFSPVVVFLSHAKVMAKSLFHRELSPGQSQQGRQAGSPCRSRQEGVKS